MIITVKRFDNKAQGRREGGAPWVQRQKVRGTPPGSDNMDGHITRTMSRMSGVHPAGRMFNPVELANSLEYLPKLERLEERVNGFEPSTYSLGSYHSTN